MDTERYHTHKTVNNPPMFRAWVAQWFDWLKNMGDLTPQNHKVGRGKTLQLDHKLYFRENPPWQQFEPSAHWLRLAEKSLTNTQTYASCYTDRKILDRKPSSMWFVHPHQVTDWLPFTTTLPSPSLRGTDFGLAILLCFSKNESNSKLPNAKPSVQSGGTLEIMT